MDGLSDHKPRDYEHLVEDPAAAEEQALALCRLLRLAAGLEQAHSIMVWDDEPSVVLAHIVGRQLGLRVARISEIEGIIDFVSGSPDGQGVLLLAPHLADSRSLLALLTLAQQAGARVTGLAVLDDSPATTAALADGVPVIALRTA